MAIVIAFLEIAIAFLIAMAMTVAALAVPAAVAMPRTVRFGAWLVSTAATTPR